MKAVLSAGGLEAGEEVFERSAPPEEGRQALGELALLSAQTVSISNEAAYRVAQRLAFRLERFELAGDHIELLTGCGASRELRAGGLQICQVVREAFQGVAELGGCGVAIDSAPLGSRLLGLGLLNDGSDLEVAEMGLQEAARFSRGNRGERRDGGQRG